MGLTLSRLNYLLRLLSSGNACNVSDSVFSSCLMACLLHLYRMPHGTASDEGNHFTAKEGQQWAQTDGIN